MVQANTSDSQALRAVFFLDPKAKVRAVLFYPMSTGRNFQELKRLLIAMQIADAQGCATPADWQPGEDVINNGTAAPCGRGSIRHPLMKTHRPPSPDCLRHTRSRVHPRCVICNPANASGLRIEFTLQADDSVAGHFIAGTVYEGYPGLVHGGVTAGLLDGAMTNCLFAHGIEALTAELTVRYREPVDVHGISTVRAWLLESHGRLHRLRAELRQEGRLKAFALGKFMENHGRFPCTL